MAESDETTATGKERLEAVSEHTKQTLTWIAELLTIFGLLGFVGSIILNSYVFSFWNLSFLQVATLSDVVMSGIQLSIDIASISIMAAIGFGVGRFLYNISPVREEDLRNSSVPMWLAEWFRRISVFGVIFLSIPLVIFVLWTGLKVLLWLNVIALAVGYIFGNINVKSVTTSTKSEIILASVIFGPIVALFFYVYIQAFLSPNSVIGGGVEDGFLSKRQVFRVDSQVKDCPRMIVLWIGERSLVGRCERTRRIVLIENGENNFLY